jgi:hypothetical protein
MSAVPATLEREAAGRRWAVPAALLGSLLPFGALVIGIGLTRGPSNRLAYLVQLDDHSTALIGLGLLFTIGMLALTAALVFLFDAARARRPELRSGLRWMIVIGGVGAALFGLVSTALSSSWPQSFLYQVVAAVRINDFVTTGDQTYKATQHAFDSPVIVVMTFAQILFTFLLAAGTIVTSLNAMRTGLLTRVIGWIGVFAGVLFALPVLSPVPIVPAVWLVALAMVFSGRFPGTKLPAWETDEAVPWPSLAEQREQAQARTRGGARASEPAAPAEPAPAPPNQPAHPGAARRKRKKRR